MSETKQSFAERAQQAAKEFSKDLVKDPNDSATRGKRLAKLHDLIIDKTNLKTMEILHPNGNEILQLRYRKLTFKELTDIQAKTSKTEVNMKDPKNPKVEITDHRLMAKLMITTQIVEPKITMEDADNLDPELVGLIADGLQKREEHTEMQLKN